MKTSFNDKTLRYFSGASSATEVIQRAQALAPDTGARPPSEAENFLAQHEIFYVRKQGGLLFVPGDIDLSHKELCELPDLGNLVVAGSFNCADNYLDNLRGCPAVVGKDFRCDQNFLRNLQYGPRWVGGSYNCQRNYFMKSLRGAPGRIEADFDCRYSRLSTLADAPRTTGGGFLCAGNGLTSLVGAPQTVGQDFDCSTNRLESLRGGPRIVRGVYDCASNRLPSLFGAPAHVSILKAEKNPLHSLEGAPGEFASLETGLGAFAAPQEIPADLRRSKNTAMRLDLFRRMRTEAVGRNMAVQRRVTVTKPLTLRKKAAGAP